MTVEYLFTTLILGFAALSLFCRGVEGAMSLLASRRGRLEGRRKAVGQRDDWYVFFHRAALTGVEESRQPPTAGPAIAAEAPRRRQRRRHAPRQYLA